MDYNRNDQNNRSGGNNQWDRWNSNASNSSYYNQPTHPPYGQGFSTASMVLGLLSVTLGCCGLSLPLGALGIFFALLVYRKGRRLNSIARTGLIFSAFGFVLGILFVVYTVLSLPAMLQNDVYRAQFETVYKAMFPEGDVEEYLNTLENFYGIPGQE